MKLTKKKIAFLAVILLIVAGIIQSIVSTRAKGKKETTNYTVCKVLKQDFHVELTFPGEMHFEKERHQYSNVKSRIAEVVHRNGDVILPGDVLFLLCEDKSEAGYLSVMEEHNLLFEQLEAEKVDLNGYENIRDEEKELWQAKIDYFSRELSLVRKKQDYSLKEYILSLENLVTSRKSRLSILKSRPGSDAYRKEKVALLTAKLSAVKTRLEHYEDRKRVRFKGERSAMIVQNMVFSDQNIVEGQDVLKYSYLDDFMVVAMVDAEDFFKINLGDKATLEIRALEEKFTAEVVYKKPIFTKNKYMAQGTVMLKPGKLAKIYPNIDCDLRLRITEKNALLVPIEAVYEKEVGMFDNWRDRGKTCVYIYDSEEGKAKERFVRVGLSDGEKIEIKSGLELSEQVFYGKLSDLKDDLKISKDRISREVTLQ